MTDFEVCAKCGGIHVTRFGAASCTAHRNKVRPLTPCTNSPLHGHHLCHMHGINGEARAKAARNVATQKLERAVAMLGVPIAPRPISEVGLEQVYEAAGNVECYRARIQELDQMTLESRQAEAALAMLGGGGKEGREISAKAPAGIYGRVDPRNWKAERHVVVGMYDDERDRLMRFVKLCRDAGVEEARLELEQEQASQVTAVLRGAFGTLLDRILAAAEAAGLAEFAATVRVLWRDEVPAIVREQALLVKSREVE